jgi:hypothetical protein
MSELGHKRKGSQRAYCVRIGSKADLIDAFWDFPPAHADSDDPGQGFQLKAATIPIEGGQYWPVGTFMGSQRW